MANMIISVSGTICHLILFVPINQGLAINLPWPALKNIQHICFALFEVFLISSAGQFFVYFLSIFGGAGWVGMVTHSLSAAPDNLL